MSEFEEVPDYFRQLRQHELRQRYNKPSEAPEPPLIMRLVDARQRGWDAADWEKLPGYVADRCAFVTYWPEYDGGFGEHFYLFPCRDTAAISWLQALAQVLGCNFETVTEDQIPRH